MALWKTALSERPLAEGSRLGELSQATARRGTTLRRPEAKASGLPSQAVTLLRSEVRPGSGRKPRCGGTEFRVVTPMPTAMASILYFCESVSQW